MCNCNKDVTVYKLREVAKPMAINALRAASIKQMVVCALVYGKQHFTLQRSNCELLVLLVERASDIQKNDYIQSQSKFIDLWNMIGVWVV